MNVCFVDTETTGLDPDRHPIWEVALITPNGDEHVWQFPVAEIDADPFALDIGHWWERRWSTDNDVSPIDAVYEAHNDKSRRKFFPTEGRAIRPTPEWARYFQRLTAGHHLAGAVVSFDEERLRRLLRSQGVVQRWHYHIIDVEPLAAGWLAGIRADAADLPSGEPSDAQMEHDVNMGIATPPWDSNALSRAVGVDPDTFDRHTALGDARWAKAIYEAVMGR